MSDELDKALDDLLSESADFVDAEKSDESSAPPIKEPISAPSIADPEPLIKRERKTLHAPRKNKKRKSILPWAIGVLALVALANSIWFWYLQKKDDVSWQDFGEEDFKSTVTDEDFQNLLRGASDEYLDSILYDEVLEEPSLTATENDISQSEEARLTEIMEKATQIVEAEHPDKPPTMEISPPPPSLIEDTKLIDIVKKATEIEEAERPNKLPVEEVASDEIAAPKAEMEESPVVEAPTPKAKVEDSPIQTAAPTEVKINAASSVVLSGISGPLQQGKEQVKFSCDLALFSKEKSLARSIKNFEAAIRVLVANIFYFSEQAQPQVNEIENEIMQKINFIFPQGKIIDVKLHNLKLELSKS